MMQSCFRTLLGLCLLSWMTSFSAFAQAKKVPVVSMDYLLGTTQYVEEIYDTADVSSHTFFLRCNYGSPKIVNPEVYEEIQASPRAIAKIDMVYTGIAQVDSFNQRRLNRKRLVELEKLAPEIFDMSLVEWKFVKQVNALSRDENRQLFHGFVVHMQPNPPGMAESTDSLSAEERIREVMRIVDSADPDTSYVEREIKGKPYYLPIWKFKRDRGITYTRRGIWPREKVYPPSTFVTDTVVTMPERDPRLKDSVVLVALRRNRSWKNFAVVQDVTGSMHPYLSQSFIWIKDLSEGAEAEDFVFFNDGDRRPDGPIGRSGGAYHVRSRDMGTVRVTAVATMRKGYGGASPENDIEALLFAQDRCGDCQSLVLIADNYAPVRDMELIDQLRLPVHIIACGATMGNINYQYVDLARRTGGSVHTLDADLDDLDQFKEGDILEVGKQKFIIEEGVLRLSR